MAQLAEQLPEWAPSYFEAEHPTIGPQDARAADKLLPETAPNGGMTILESIERRLGLRIQLQKHPAVTGASPFLIHKTNHFSLHRPKHVLRPCYS